VTRDTRQTHRYSQATRSSSPLASAPRAATTYRRSGWEISSASWNTVHASSGNSASSAKAISSTSSSVAGRSAQARAESPSGAVISAAQCALARVVLRGVRCARVHRLGAGEVLPPGGERGRGEDQVTGIDVHELRGGGQLLGVHRGAGADQQVAGGQRLGDVGGGAHGGL